MAVLAAHPTLYLPWARGTPQIEKQKPSRSFFAMWGMIVLHCFVRLDVWALLFLLSQLTQKEQEQLWDI